MMKPDTRSLRDLLADVTVYGERQSESDGSWRKRLLARQPRRARPRVVSQAAEYRRLLLYVGLPLAAIVLVTLIATFGMPTLPGADAVRERVMRISLPEAPSLLSWPALTGLPALGEVHVPGGHYLWLIPVALSALFTLIARGRITRLLPLDW